MKNNLNGLNNLKRNNMEKEFIPYQQALALKELGFDEPCFAYRAEGAEVMIKYIPNCVISAPTFSQAFRWFREKYDLNHEIPYAGRPKEYHAFVRDYVYGNNRNSPSVFSYEEAELACLNKLIEIIKNEKHTRNTNRQTKYVI